MDRLLNVLDIYFEKAMEDYTNSIRNWDFQRISYLEGLCDAYENIYNEIEQIEKLY